MIMRDKIEYAMILIFDDKGGARMTRVPGKLAANERAMDLSVTLPTSMFKRPSLKASIEVQPGEISIPPIDLAALSSTLRDAFGADVLLTVHSQE